MKNGRILEASGTSLDSTGFALHDHLSKVDNWDDEKHVKAVYYPEIAQYVKRLTGAELVFCNDHSIRCTEDTVPSDVAAAAQNADAGANADPLGLSMKNPIPSVHNDFTRSYATALARALELDEPAEARMATFGLL